MTIHRYQKTEEFPACIRTF